MASRETAPATAAPPDHSRIRMGQLRTAALFVGVEASSSRGESAGMDGLGRRARADYRNRIRAHRWAGSSVGAKGCTWPARPCRRLADELASSSVFDNAYSAVCWEFPLGDKDVTASIQVDS